MILNWSDIITACSVLLGSLSGGAGLYFYKQNRELKQTQVDEARIDNGIKMAEQEHRRYLETLGLWHDSEDKIDRQAAKIEELKDELRAAHEREYHIQILLEHEREYRCIDLSCNKRTPPRDYERIDSIYERLRKEYYKSTCINNPCSVNLLQAAAEYDNAGADALPD